MENIKKEAYSAVKELIETAKLKSGSVLVVGCSSSEVIGKTIGTNSSEDTAKSIYEGITKALEGTGIFLAAQCCEHLNRALIIEEELLNKKGLSEVSVVPQKKAGGSFATAVYNGMKNPVAVEEIYADAGLDIGDTLIGMHLKRVAVPVRLSIQKIGSAHITAARVRPKFIGGERAIYDQNKL